jgi:hypothetical protein
MADVTRRAHAGQGNMESLTGGIGRSGSRTSTTPWFIFGAGDIAFLPGRAHVEGNRSAKQAPETAFAPHKPSDAEVPGKIFVSYFEIGPLTSYRCERQINSETTWRSKVGIFTMKHKWTLRQENGPDRELPYGSDLSPLRSG